MTREDKRAYNYARDRLANDDYPVYSDEYELELAYKAGIEDAKNHPHWISVEDELPKIIVNKLLWDYSDDVLVYLKDGSITVGRWERDNSTGEQYWLLDIDKDVIVTHWMPMPEAPKEGGEE